MTGRRVLIVAAWVSGALVLALALRSSVYAPGAGLAERLRFVQSAVRAMHDLLPFTHIGVALALRKFYSIVAFAFVGILTALSRRRMLRVQIARSAALVAGLSACIEILQRVTGSHETLKWNLVDVLCGAVGGALGPPIVFGAAAFFAKVSGQHGNVVPHRSARKV